MNFDLQKPSYVPDDLDEATTNDGSSIEIEIVGEVMEHLDNGPVRFENLPPGSGNFEKKWSLTVDHADNYGMLVLLLVVSF